MVRVPAAYSQGLGKTLIILALITLQRQNTEKIFARDEALFPLADVRAGQHLISLVVEGLCVCVSY